ncbi:hypothetical protein BSFA1_64960 (plasmid) [Burkholderia sp. SFA1]|nr:hypothetical protein BSFA1_64960 [Burkholderia sp. SFA1]
MKECWEAITVSKTAGDMIAGTAGRTVNRTVDRMTTDTAITATATAILAGMPTNALALPMKGGAERPAALLPRRNPA